MPTASPLTVNDLAATLRAVIHGDVVTPGEASFPAASFGIDASPASRPGVVVIAADANDAAEVVRVATRAGRRVVVHAAGNLPVQVRSEDILLVSSSAEREPIARTFAFAADQPSKRRCRHLAG